MKGHDDSISFSIVAMIALFPTPKLQVGGIFSTSTTAYSLIVEGMAD